MSLAVSSQLSLLLWLIVVSVPVTAGRSPRITIKRSADVLNLMEMFGYNSDGSGIGKLLDPATALNQSVTIFQKIWGLPQTGKLDEKTLILMNTDRCGNKDEALVLHAKGITNSKRSVPTVPWPKTHLTWNISDYRLGDVIGLTKNQIDAGVQEVFAIWASSSDLTFTRDTLNKPDINIWFASPYHPPCPYPFQQPGPGKDLAHAFFPTTGEMHLDVSETWTYKTDGPDMTFELTYVMLHELGHGIGLDHSNAPGSIMNPYYEYRSPLAVGEDDKEGLAILYSPQVVPLPTTTPTPLQAWCRNAGIDAVTEMPSGEILFFKGDEYAIVNNAGIENVYPQKITKTFSALKTGVDAAFLMSTVKLCQSVQPPYAYFRCIDQTYYFFKGPSYVKYSVTGFQMQAIGSIETDFPGIPTDIDSAFTRKDGNVWFTKGNQIYKFIRGQGVAPGFPKLISEVITGLPAQINGAFYKQYSIQGGTYSLNFFLAGTNYYQVIDAGLALSAVTVMFDFPFPRPTNNWWFGCKDVGSLRDLSSNDTDLTSTQTLLAQSNAMNDFKSLTPSMSGALFTASGDPVPADMPVVNMPTDGSATVDDNANPLQVVMETSTNAPAASGPTTAAAHGSSERIRVHVTFSSLAVVICAYWLSKF